MVCPKPSTNFTGILLSLSACQWSTWRFYTSPFSSFPLLSHSFLSFSSKQTRQGDQRDRERDPSMEERETERLWWWDNIINHEHTVDEIPNLLFLRVLQFQVGIHGLHFAHSRENRKRFQREFCFWFENKPLGSRRREVFPTGNLIDLREFPFYSHNNPENLRFYLLAQAPFDLQEGESHHRPQQWDQDKILIVNVGDPNRRPWCRQRWGELSHWRRWRGGGGPSRQRGCPWFWSSCGACRW